MPKLFPDGRVYMGVGNGTVSIDGVPLLHLQPGTAGGGGPISNRYIIYQRTDGDIARVEVYDLQQRVPVNTIPQGANHIVQRDGVWAMWAAGSGYLDSWGHTHPEWFPLDVVHGEVIVKPVYHGPEAYASWDGHELLPLAERPWPYSWKCGHIDGFGLCAWEHKTVGVVLSGDGFDFNPDVVVLANGRVRVASSTTNGEGPSHIRVYEFDPSTAPRVDLTQPPQPPPPPPPPVFTFVPFMPDITYAVRALGAFLSNEPGHSAIETRTAVGAWEKLKILKRADNRFTLEFINSGNVLCITPDGRFETRPTGTAGAWEVFVGGISPSGESIAVLASAIGTRTPVIALVKQ